MTTENIYVRLLNEGTPVKRLTEANYHGGGRFELRAPQGYAADDEEWEFPPNSIVTCEEEISGGRVIGVAPKLATEEKS